MYRIVHAVAISIVFNRVPHQNLPEFGPQKDIKKCNVLDIVTVNKDDLEARRSRHKVIVANLLFENFKAFEIFRPYVPQATEFIYEKEMSASQRFKLCRC